MIFIHNTISFEFEDNSVAPNVLFLPFYLKVYPKQFFPFFWLVLNPLKNLSSLRNILWYCTYFTCSYVYTHIHVCITQIQTQIHNTRKCLWRFFSWRSFWIISRIKSLINFTNTCKLESLFLIYFLGYQIVSILTKLRFRWALRSC